MKTAYTVKVDGESVLIGVPITNVTASRVEDVSVVFGAFNGNITLTNNYKDVGTYTTLTRTWDGFGLDAGETQVIYLKFTVTDVYLLPVTITGTITNAVDGNDGAGTAISITISNEDVIDNFTSYAALFSQTGTNAPTAVGLSNTIGATYTFARSGVGVYTITADSGTPFTAGKTAIIVSLNGSGAVGRITAVATSTTVVTISTYNESFVLTDALLNSTLVEIKVYGTPVFA